MDRDLTVYTYHPRPRVLLAPLIIILAMAVLGFVRGLMGAADLVQPGFGGRGQSQAVGKEPRPVILETIPSLTPRLIGSAPPPPKAPVAVNAPAVAQAPATNSIVNAPLTKTEATAPTAPPPVEAAPAPPPAAPAPPAPPAALQGLY
jgi:hypothetical protein